MTFHEPFTIDSLNSCENTRFPAVVLSYISIVTFPSARRFPVAVSLTFVPWSEIKKAEVILVKSITKNNKTPHFLSPSFFSNSIRALFKERERGTLSFHLLQISSGISNKNFFTFASFFILLSKTYL